MCSGEQKGSPSSAWSKQDLFSALKADGPRDRSHASWLVRGHDLSPQVVEARGLQAGAEVTDFVMVLNNNAAVQAFSRGGNVTIGVDVSAAAGPVGRTAAGAVMPTAAVSFTAGAKAFSLASHWKAL